jgi:hypothetical protein
MDKIMKRLEIMLAIPSFEVVSVVHYNVDGRPIGGGKTSWLITLWGCALKLNPTIDDIHKQLVEEMEAIKKDLDH